MSEPESSTPRILEEAAAIIDNEAARIETSQHRREHWKAIGHAILTSYSKSAFGPFGWTMLRGEQDKPTTS